MDIRRISIARDFSATPGGRFFEDGPFSGQRFREELLLPALISENQVEVDFSGAEGFGSSFLEEAFGGVVRSKKISSEALLKKLILLPKSSSYVSECKSYIENAIRDTR